MSKVYLFPTAQLVPGVSIACAGVQVDWQLMAAEKRQLDCFSLCVNISYSTL